MKRYPQALFPLAFGLLLSVTADADVIENGRAIYFDGRRTNGSLVSAEVAGGAVLKGDLAACVRCHRPSGYGSSEGDIRTAEIAAPTLFNRLEPRRDRLMRSLFQERYGPLTQVQAKTPRSRPAYADANDILKAVRQGIDTAGKSLSPMMPRYDIDLEDAAALKTFLQTLGSRATPGIDSDTIHFATIIGADVDDDRKKTMLTVMRAFIKRRNRELRRERSRPDYSPLYKSELLHARRYWRLHVWTLPERREDWRSFLEQQYSSHPVFAVLGGLVNGAWKPIHNFCEDTQLPCLFPQTDWPLSIPGRYTLYLSEGLPGEARLIADRLKEINAHSVLQITGEDHNAVDVAIVLENFARERGLPIETISMTKFLRGELQENKRFDSAVLWFNACDFVMFSEFDTAESLPATLFAAGSLLATNDRRLPKRLPQDLNLSWQYALPGQEPPRLYRLRGWLAARQIPAKQETTALNTYLVLDAVRHALVHAVDRYSKEYLIEIIEHEIENQLNPGTFPRLSLGPGQRFAAKGLRIINQTKISGNVFGEISFTAGKNVMSESRLKCKTTQL
jgi:hypothetical protein